MKMNRRYRETFRIRILIFYSLRRNDDRPFFYRPFGTDTRARPAVDTLYGDDSAAFLHVYRLGRTNIKTRPASGALMRNRVLHI